MVSVSRFDCPHKNYLLGLIDDYAKLKPEYTKLSLHIVGYGKGQNVVKKRIADLPPEVRRDVFLHGTMDVQQLADFLKEMSLNISVAGSASIGARLGVLTIPARNFCEDVCEVYGFYPEAGSMTTAIVPGEAAIGYIRQVVEMSEEEYIQKSQLCYSFSINRSVDPEYLFKQIPKENQNLRQYAFFFVSNRYFHTLAYKIKMIVKRGLGKSKK